MEINDLLKDKVAIVTGGAGLLGKEFIKAIVAAGGTGIIADIDQELGAKVAAALMTELGTQKIASFVLDITDSDSLDRLISQVKTKYGRIDALVNNAYPRNRNYGRKFEQVNYADFCENIGLHLGGYFLSMQRFAEFFAKNGGGTIINIASIYGITAPRFEVYEGTAMTMPVEYAAIKAGIIHLTKYVAKYYKGKNLRVNTLSPGGVLSGQMVSFTNKYKEYCLSKGMLDNIDIAGSLVYLLSDLAMYVNGQNIIIDDGFTL